MYGSNFSCNALLTPLKLCFLSIFLRDTSLLYAVATLKAVEWH